MQSAGEKHDQQIGVGEGRGKKRKELSECEEDDQQTGGGGGKKRKAKYKTSPIRLSESQEDDVRCMVRMCHDRFRNETVRLKHMLEAHGLTQEQIRVAKEVDASNMARRYCVVDELAWLKAHPCMENESEASRSPELFELAIEFAEIHSENRFRIATLSKEINAWRQLTAMDSACRRARERHLALLTEGKKKMLDEARYTMLTDMWTKVQVRRINENRHASKYIEEMERSRKEDPLVRMFLMNNADFQHSLQKLGGLDFSALDNQTLGFDAVYDNAKRAPGMAHRLLNHRLDPDGDRAMSARCT